MRINENCQSEPVKKQSETVEKPDDLHGDKLLITFARRLIIQREASICGLTKQL